MILKRLRTTDLNPERAPLHSLLPGQGVQLKPCSSYSKPPKTKEADTTERLNNKKDQTSQSHSWGESLLIQVCRSHPSSYVPTQGWIRWPHSNSCWPRCDWTSLLLGLLPPSHLHSILKIYKPSCVWHMQGTTNRYLDKWKR